MTSTPHLPKDYAIPSIHCTLDECKKEIYVIDRLVPHIRKCGILYTRDKVRLPHHTYVYAMDLNDRQREIIRKMMIFECYGLFERTVASDKWWVHYLNSKGHKNIYGNPIKRNVFQRDLKYLEELKLIHRNTYTLPKIAQGGKKRNMTTAWGITQYSKWVNKVRTYKGNVHIKPDSVKEACAIYMAEVHDLNHVTKPIPLVLRGKKTSINKSSSSKNVLDKNYIYSRVETQFKEKNPNLHNQKLWTNQAIMDFWLKKEDIHCPDAYLVSLLDHLGLRKKIIYALCQRQKWLNGLEHDILDNLDKIFSNPHKIHAKNPLRLAIAWAKNPLNHQKFEKQTKPLTKYDNYHELFKHLEWKETYCQEEIPLPENLIDMARSFAFELKEKFGEETFENMGFDIVDDGIVHGIGRPPLGYNSPTVFMSIMDAARTERRKDIFDYAKEKFRVG